MRIYAAPGTTPRLARHPPAARPGLVVLLLVVLLLVVAVVAAVASPSRATAAEPVGAAGDRASTGSLAVGDGATPVSFTPPASLAVSNEGIRTPRDYCMGPCWYNVKWYSWTPAASGRLLVRAAPVGRWESTLEIWSGGRLLGQSDNSDAGPQVAFDYVAGTKYLMGLGGYREGSDGAATFYLSSSAPSVPGRPSVYPGNGSVRLDWSAPRAQQDGVSEYRITWYSGGPQQVGMATVLGAPPYSGAVVAGLTNGIGYTFRVVAVNGSGRSPESQPSPTVVPVAIPSAPTAVRAAFLGAGVVQVDWRPPKVSGGTAITSYRAVASSPGRKPGACTTGPSANSCRIGGLASYVYYTVSITAENSVGTSIPSAPSALIVYPSSAVPLPGATSTAAPGGNTSGTPGPGQGAAPGTAPVPSSTPEDPPESAAAGLPADLPSAGGGQVGQAAGDDPGPTPTDGETAATAPERSAGGAAPDGAQAEPDAGPPPDEAQSDTAGGDPPGAGAADQPASPGGGDPAAAAPPGQLPASDGEETAPSAPPVGDGQPVALADAFPPYLPEAMADQLLPGVVASSVAILAAVGGMAAAGLAGTTAGTGSSSRSDKSKGSGGTSGGTAEAAGWEEAELLAEREGTSRRRWGDRSGTFSLMIGMAKVDRWSRRVPGGVAPVSPLLATILADGTYLRAALGSLWVVLPIAGFELGALVANGGDIAHPPVAAMAACIVLGVLDAAAGLMAVLGYFVVGIATGAISDAPSLRLALGVTILWIILPILVRKIRPFTRENISGFPDFYDRTADFVIAAAVSCWVSYTVVQAWPGLAGVSIPVDEFAGPIAWFALAAITVRMAVESIITWGYPHRIGWCFPDRVPGPGRLQQFVSLTLSVALFVFVWSAFMGGTWQLWATAAIVFLPVVLGFLDDRLPNSEKLRKFVPVGITAIVLSLLIEQFALRIMHDQLSGSPNQLATGVLGLTALVMMLAIISFFGRHGDRFPMTWTARIAGIGVFAVGTWLAVAGFV